jgi:hypothetical protein
MAMTAIQTALAATEAPRLSSGETFPRQWLTAGGMVGAVSFDQLDTHSFTYAFKHSAPVVIGFFAAAALLSLALPRTAVGEEEVTEL